MMTIKVGDTVKVLYPRESVPAFAAVLRVNDEGTADLRMRDGQERKRVPLGFLSDDPDRRAHDEVVSESDPTPTKKLLAELNAFRRADGKCTHSRWHRLLLPELDAYRRAASQ